jgi:hypothetical protein
MVRGLGKSKGPDLSSVGRELTLAQLEQALDERPDEPHTICWRPRTMPTTERCAPLRLEPRRQIDARPGIHIVRAVLGVSQGVIAIGGSQLSKSGAIEVDAVIVGEVRVLAGIHAARTRG